MQKFSAKALPLAVVVLALATAATAGNTDNHDVTVTVEDICSLEVTAGAVSLAVKAPTAPGTLLITTADDKTKAVYTSLLRRGETRILNARISAGAVPAGLALRLEAKSVPKNCGTASAARTLHSSDQNIVTAIGSCKTGEANGPILRYTLNVTAPAALSPTVTNDINVELTLTDGS